MSPKRPKTGGRTAGTPNKATKEFRATIQSLLDKNADNVSQWLEDVANGVVVRNEDGSVAEVISGPDPSKALEHIARLAEYAAPKLSRSELSGPNGGEIPTSITITHVKPQPTGS